MIDTNKYEGHTPGPWKADYSFPRYKQIQTGLAGPDGKELGFGYSEEEQIANAELIADAPLLLEEVKRLRKELEQCWEYISHIENHDMQSLADDSYKEERDRLRGKLNE